MIKVGEKELVKGKRSIKIQHGNDLKAFLRFPKGTTQSTIQSMISNIRASDVIFMPNDWEVIVIRSDGTTEKL